MIAVPMYAPKTDEDPSREARMGRFLANTVDPGSAIVGQPEESPDVDGMIVVYFEGNRYHAGNMVTFADRAMFAYWRMRDRYPTVAMMAAPLSQLQRIGTLYPEHGRIEVDGAEQLVACAHWLGIEELEPNGEWGDRLYAELRCDGVRAGGAR